MNQDDSNYKQTFTKENTDIIVAAIQRAVNNACDQHDPAIGCNATTFGVNIYNFGVHELKKLATQFPQIFKYQATGNLFRLFIGDYELAFHKVGYDVSEGIENSFPNNEGAVSRILLQQEAQLAFIGDGFESKPTKKFILAHFASHQDGLSGVYLCSPSKKQFALEWEVIHELWKNINVGEESKNLHSLEASIENIGDFTLQPKEKINEIVLRPRKEKDRIKTNHE